MIVPQHSLAVYSCAVTGSAPITATLRPFAASWRRQAVPGHLNTHGKSALRLGVTRLVRQVNQEAGVAARSWMISTASEKLKCVGWLRSRKRVQDQHVEIAEKLSDESGISLASVM